MAPATTAPTCAYSGCGRPVERRGGQGAVTKIYCSNSCRTRAHQERSLRAAERPDDALRKAVSQAHAALDTEVVNDALAFMPDDIRRNTLKAREVLAEVVARIPTTPAR
jgi:hypothetical protein